MAHGKIRVNTLTYDTGSGDVDVAVSGIPTASDIAGKADAANAALTGTPTAPTAASGTNTTQIATTAFVRLLFLLLTLTLQRLMSLKPLPRHNVVTSSM